MRNRAKCKNCGDVIESKHRHDWVACTCFDKSHKLLDDYTDKHHKTGVTKTKFGDHEFTSDDIDYEGLYADPKYKKLQDEFHGFFLDGGQDYIRCGGNDSDIEWLKEEESNE